MQFEDLMTQMLALAGDFLVFTYSSAPTRVFSRGDRYASLQGCGMTLSIFKSGGVFLDLEKDWDVDKGFEEDPNFQDDRTMLVRLARSLGAKLPQELEGY